MRPLRALLPAGAGTPKNDPPPSRLKQDRVSACEPCRSRKTKCDGNRPICATCTTRATDCYYSETESRSVKRKYEELRRKKTDHEELVELFRVLSDDDASALLRRLRAGADVKNLVRQMQAGDLLLQFALSPETRRRYEFPYLPNMPETLLVPENPYLEAILFDTTLEKSQHSGSPSGGLWKSDAYTKPYQAAEVVEPLLTDADISRWTCVSSDNKLLRSLFRWYLLRIYNELIPLPKDIFLEDLASGGTDYCSPLLVNAVLAAACHNHHKLPDREKFWLPDSLIYKFLAEAKRLWEVESMGECRLTTVQAALLLASISNLNGVDKVGLSYVYQGIDMCRKLGLFKSSAQTRSPKERISRVWTAWTTYAYITQISYFFLRVPLIVQPPDDPLPDPNIDPSWYGEIWLQYSQSNVLVPIHFAHSMKARFDLLVVLNEIATESFTGSRSLTLKRARYFYSKLQGWHERLPAPLSAQAIFSPTHFLIHLDYCNAVVSLFEPHLDPDGDLGTINTEDTPEHIVEIGKIKIETLLRLYYLRHSYEAFACHIAIYMMILGNRALGSLKTMDRQRNGHPNATCEALRSTLILCAKGLRDQANSFYLGALLYLALCSAIEPEELQLLHTCTHAMPDIERPVLPEHALLDWPVPIIKMNEDPDKAVLAKLIKQHENTRLEAKPADESTPGPE